MEQTIRAQQVIKKMAAPIWRSRLDRLREDVGISTKMLNSLVPKITGRMVSDYRFLSATEIRTVMDYIRIHRTMLEEMGRMERYGVHQ
jgi:hypothetical protein